MKIKITILLLITIILSGCYNYVEINNLVLVSGIGIDYENNMYNVSFETLYQDKESSDSNFEKGIIKTGKGKTLGEAFDNITLGIEKEPYFAHLKVLVISQSIAENHLNEIFDFFLRNNDIRNIFSIVVADNTKPEKVLSNSDNYFPVASEKIKNLLENNVYSNYISKNKYFKNVASNYLSKDKNISLSTVTFENDELKLGRIIVFNNKKPVGSLNNDMSLILSIIDNTKPSSLLTINYEENKNVTIRIYKSNTKIKIMDDKFIIKNNLMAEVVENSLNINLENTKSEYKIKKEFEDLINNKTETLVKYLQNINSDVLGINRMYYIKNRKKDKTYFQSKDFEIITNLEINKKGLIFEVKKWLLTSKNYQ